MDSISFEIPHTPENKAAFDALKEESLKGDYTLYGVNGDGDYFPILTIVKHADCPEGWYESIIKRILKIVEEE